MDPLRRGVALSGKVVKRIGPKRGQGGQEDASGPGEVQSLRQNQHSQIVA